MARRGFKWRTVYSNLQVNYDPHNVTQRAELQNQAGYIINAFKIGCHETCETCLSSLTAQSYDDVSSDDVITGHSLQICSNGLLEMFLDAENYFRSVDIPQTK